MNSFYSREELMTIGFKHIGENNVLISRKASIYSPESISIGDNVRIDDFCILSGHIEIGNYIHIAAYTALYGGNKGIYIKDFVGLSSRVTVYSTNDDYSGETMTNPMIPDKFKNVSSQPVHIGKHAIIGSTSVILPGVNIGEGTSVGSMALVNKSLDAWGVYVGIPCRKIKYRSKRLLELEEQFLSDVKNKQDKKNV